MMEHNDTKPSINDTLCIPQPNVSLTPYVPKEHLCYALHNLNVCASHYYSIMDDLAHSPATVSSLEIL